MTQIGLYFLSLATINYKMNQLEHYEAYFTSPDQKNFWHRVKTNSSVENSPNYTRIESGRSIGLKSMQARTGSTFANSQFFNLPNNDSEVTLGPSIGSEEVQEMFEWMEMVRFMTHEQQQKRTDILQREQNIMKITIDLAQMEESIKEKKELLKKRDEKCRKQAHHIKVRRHKKQKMYTERIEAKTEEMRVLKKYHKRLETQKVNKTYSHSYMPKQEKVRHEPSRQRMKKTVYIPIVQASPLNYFNPFQPRPPSSNYTPSQVTQRLFYQGNDQNNTQNMVNMPMKKWSTPNLKRKKPSSGAPVSQPVIMEELAAALNKKFETQELIDQEDNHLDYFNGATSSNNTSVRRSNSVKNEKSIRKSNNSSGMMPARQTSGKWKKDEEDIELVEMISNKLSSGEQKKQSPRPPKYKKKNEVVINVIEADRSRQDTPTITSGRNDPSSDNKSFVNIAVESAEEKRNTSDSGSHSHEYQTINPDDRFRRQSIQSVVKVDVPESNSGSGRSRTFSKQRFSLQDHIKKIDEQPESLFNTPIIKASQELVLKKKSMSNPPVYGDSQEDPSDMSSSKPLGDQQEQEQDMLGEINLSPQSRNQGKEVVNKLASKIHKSKIKHKTHKQEDEDMLDEINLNPQSRNEGKEVANKLASKIYKSRIHPKNPAKDDEEVKVNLFKQFSQPPPSKIMSKTTYKKNQPIKVEEVPYDEELDFLEDVSLSTESKISRQKKSGMLKKSNRVQEIEEIKEEKVTQESRQDDEFDIRPRRSSKSTIVRKGSKARASPPLPMKVPQQSNAGLLKSSRMLSEPIEEMAQEETTSSLVYRNRQSR